MLESEHQHGDAQCHHSFKKILARKTTIKFGEAITRRACSVLSMPCNDTPKRLLPSVAVPKQGIKDSTGIAVFLQRCFQLLACLSKFNRGLEFVS